MTDKEILEMQRRIDDGIRLAQKRLWRRAGATHQGLIVARGGQIQEMVPEEDDTVGLTSTGDPLARHNNR